MSTASLALPLVVAVLVWAMAVRARLESRLELVARADHELRGPLHAARLVLGASCPPAARIAAVDLELARATLAVQELTAARCGTAGPAPAHREPVDAAALCAGAAPSWQALAASWGAALTCDTPEHGLFVSADRARLAQAIANLVANAAEHGAPGRRVTLRVRRAADRVEVAVFDDGPGLPAPLGVLATARRSARGSRGRGLGIAAAAAQACGGLLAAARPPESRGACLVIVLPALAGSKILDPTEPAELAVAR